MIIFIVCLVAVVVAIFVALILGYQGGVSTFLSPQTDRSLLVPLMDDGRTVDLNRVRFDRAFRGYRMEQVDQLLDALLQERLAGATDSTKDEGAKDPQSDTPGSAASPRPESAPEPAAESKAPRSRPDDDIPGAMKTSITPESPKAAPHAGTTSKPADEVF